MYSLSDRERKLLIALRQKKRRDEYRLFVAEGEKVIGQMLPFFRLRYMITTEERFPDTWMTMERNLCRRVDVTMMRKLSLLESPTPYIAIFEKPDPSPIATTSSLSIALERIQDPGNLGTIIRLADWMGVQQLLLSHASADPYAPKVVQATAGALGNVAIHTDLNLRELLPEHYQHIIGTTLNGETIDRVILPDGAAPRDIVLLFGNEGQGLSEELLSICHHRVTIPPASTTISESLNIAISVTILLTHFSNL